MEVCVVGHSQDQEETHTRELRCYPKRDEQPPYVLERPVFKKKILENNRRSAKSGKSQVMFLSHPRENEKVCYCDQGGNVKILIYPVQKVTQKLCICLILASPVTCAVAIRIKETARGPLVN